MHTFKASDGTVFISNSDLSGGVYINVDPSKVSNESWGGEKNTKVEIPGHALIEFVAEYIRTEKIAQLERASIAEILRG